MNRLYAVEHADDHRRDGRPPPRRAVARRRRLLATAIARALKLEGAPDDRSGRLARHAALDRGPGRRPGRPRGKSLVVAGETQPPAVHAPGARDQPGAGQRRQDGRLLRAARGRGPADQVDSLRDLVARHRRGHGRHAPDPGRQPGLRRPGRPRVRRGARERKVQLRIHLGLYEDETSAALPLARPRGAHAGGLGRRPGLRRHGDDPAAADRAALRRQVGARAARRRCWASRPRPASRSSATTGRRQSLPGDFETFWRTSLHDGVVAGTAGRREAGRRRSSSTPLPSQATPAASEAAAWSSSSGPTRRSGTAGSPTTAGSRSCPSR